MLGRRNPDDLTLLARVKLKVQKSRSRVTVWAYDGGNEIAKATFWRAPWTAAAYRKDVLMSALTEVAPAYRRKGVASLIYRTLTAQGFTIHPASAQTTAGAEMWKGGRWPGKREAYEQAFPSTWKEKVATLRTNPDDAAFARGRRKNPDDDPWREPSFTSRMKKTGLISMIENARRNGSSCGWAKPVGGGEYDCVYTSPGDDSDHGWLTGHMGYDPGHQGDAGWYDAMQGGWIRFAMFVGHYDPKVRGLVYLSGISESKLRAMFSAIPRHELWDATVVRHRTSGDETTSDTIINQRRSNPTRRRNPDDQDLLRRLTVETDDDPRWARGKVDHYLEFRAFDGKLQAATANFRVRRKYLEAVEVIVNPAWRRRGLASWLYRYAERSTGMTVKHSKDQTTDGKAFAKGRRRNPGDPKALEAELVKKLGADGDSSVMRAWILTDGRIVDLDERDELGERDVRDEHGRVDELFPLAGYDEIRGVDDLVDVHRTFMRLTGAIRLADGERASMLHLLTVPTPAQVTTCGKIAATHRNMEQDSIEIYWEPADRFVEVRPISAGKVRRILEALPGEPKARANPRRNPPADLDSSEVIGGECGVWALAAATGRSVPDIRRAYLAAGVDIWGDGGQATGTKMHQMRRVIRHLGLDDRIVSVGFDAIHRGPRASMAMAVKNRFVTGSDGETFPVPNQEMSTVLDHATVGQIVAKARKSGLAAIAITGEITSKIRRGGGNRWREIGGTMHAIGYSPSQGVFDSAVPNLGVINDPDYKALLGDKKPTGWHWSAHGDVVPKPARKALFWLFLRPAAARS